MKWLAGALLIGCSWTAVARADGPSPGTIEAVIVTDAFLEAASAFEEYARAHPELEDAPRALERAIEIRMALRQSIDSDVALHAELFGQRDPRAVDRVELRHVQYVLGSGGTLTPARLTRLDETLARLGQRREKAIRWPAMVLQAQLKRRSGNEQAALAIYRGMTRELRPKARLDVRAADAMGEAIYEAAAAGFDKLNILIPATHAPNDTSGAQLTVDLRGWAQGKRKEMKRLARGFAGLEKLRPRAGRWQARADAFVAAKWRRLVASVRTSPYPRAWDREGFVPGLDPPRLWAELRSWFLADVDEQSEVLRDETRVANERCVATGLARQHFDWMGECEEYLVLHFPGAHPLFERPSMTLKTSGIADALYLQR